MQRIDTKSSTQGKRKKSMRKVLYVVVGLFLLVTFVGSLGEPTEQYPADGIAVQSEEQKDSGLLDTTLKESGNVPIMASVPLGVEDAQEQLNIRTEPPSGTYYDVVKVVDGDTLSVDLNGAVTTLRLIGIDTPETVDPRKKVECFGQEASSRAKELLTGKRVRIEYDASQGEYDKYDRLLAYVYLEDGLFFNKLMIEEGYAHEYTYNQPYGYQMEFKEAELLAKNNGKGLWALGVCDAFNTPQVMPPEALPATEVETQVSPTRAGSYVCTSNTYNCTDFGSHAEAQSVYDQCGGVGNDIHRLDSDADGVACESLP